MLDLKEVNSRIPGMDESALQGAYDRWSKVAHPLKSLGVLEDIVAQIAGVTGDVKFDFSRRVLIAMCSDNGVIAQGVTQSDESITTLVAGDLAKGISSANLMADIAKVDVISVDVGVKTPSTVPGVVDRCIARGTADFTQGPAMTKEQALRAVEIGIEMVKEAKDKGYTAIATGEMGIGNTTTSVAVCSVLLGCDPEEITGRGAGLTTAGLNRKVDAIKRGIALNKPDPEDALDVVSKVGGFDIAAMAGLYIGGALYRAPVVIDGVISAVAALVAQRMCPACAYAMIPSHISLEPAAQKVFDALGMKPVIHAGMHLGEGTGAVCLFPLIDMALSLYNGFDFGEIGMDAYVPLS